MDIIISFIISVVSAVVSARVTLHYALKRFYFEKWWERKAEAYTSILEALHHLKNHIDHELEFNKIHPSLYEKGQKVLNELTEKMKDAIDEIRKQADIGAFVISEEAVNALHTLLTELEESVSKLKIPAITEVINSKQILREHFDLKLSAVNKCLEFMRYTAKNDLKGG
ncbi:MAG: hypothetical protein ACLQUS_14825 [Desulfobaccales bacterium]